MQYCCESEVGSKDVLRFHVGGSAFCVIITLAVYYGRPKAFWSLRKYYASIEKRFARGAGAMETWSIYSFKHVISEIVKTSLHRKRHLPQITNFFNPIFICNPPRVYLIFAFCFLWCHPAIAQASEILVLGGIKWTIPSSYIASKSSAGTVLRSITLDYSLPGFNPVSFNAFSDQPKEDEKPIFSITLSENTTAITGTALLDQIKAQFGLKCSGCLGEGAFGQEEYSNYVSDAWPFIDPRNATLFNLYVHKTPSGMQLLVCRFGQDLSPQPCEIKERISPNLIVTYKIPQEFISQSEDIVTEGRVLLNRYKLPDVSQGAHSADKGLEPSTCWTPKSESDRLERLNVRFGPEIWHIPKVYAENLGFSPGQNISDEGFVIFLKLPDLEPLQPSDPSPFEIRGHGSYIYISISYDDRPGTGPTVSHVTKNGIMSSDWLHYIGANDTVDYQEFYENGLLSAYMYSPVSQVHFITADPTITESSFPPQNFWCDQFNPSKSPGCAFDVWQKANNGDNTLTNRGYYLISYNFSRDYFSQIDQISQCVSTLVKDFQYPEISKNSGLRN